MIFPAMSKSCLLLIINASFCALRSLRFSICACKRCSEMVSVSASFSLHIDYPPLHRERKPCRALAHLTHHLRRAASAGLAWPATTLLTSCGRLHRQANSTCSYNPFHCSTGQAGMNFLPEERWERWRHRQVWERSQGLTYELWGRAAAETWGLQIPLCCLRWKSTSFGFFFFSWLFNRLLNPVLSPVWASLQPCGNHLALICAK